MNTKMNETSSFTNRDEMWFTAPAKPRHDSKRPAPRSETPIGDPIADRWFR